MMRRIVELFGVYALALFILGLIAEGLIPLPFGMAALLALVILRAIGRGRGGHLARTVKRTFALAVPIVSTVLFLVMFTSGNPNQLPGLLAQLIGLLVLVTGVYVMIRGLVASR